MHALETKPYLHYTFIAFRVKRKMQNTDNFLYFCITVLKPCRVAYQYEYAMGRISVKSEQNTINPAQQWHRSGGNTGDL